MVNVNKINAIKINNDLEPFQDEKKQIVNKPIEPAQKILKNIQPDGNKNTLCNRIFKVLKDIFFKVFFCCNKKKENIPVLKKKEVEPPKVKNVPAPKENKAEAPKLEDIPLPKEKEAKAPKEKNVPPLNDEDKARLEDINKAFPYNRDINTDEQRHSAACSEKAMNLMFNEIPDDKENQLKGRPYSVEELAQRHLELKNIIPSIRREHINCEVILTEELPILATQPEMTKRSKITLLHLALRQIKDLETLKEVVSLLLERGANYN